MARETEVRPPDQVDKLADAIIDLEISADDFSKDTRIEKADDATSLMEQLSGLSEAIRKAYEAAAKTPSPDDDAIVDALQKKITDLFRDKLNKNTKMRVEARTALFRFVRSSLRLSRATTSPDRFQPAQIAASDAFHQMTEQAKVINHENIDPSGLTKGIVDIAKQKLQQSNVLNPTEPLIKNFDSHNLVPAINDIDPSKFNLGNNSTDVAGWKTELEVFAQKLSEKGGRTELTQGEEDRVNGILRRLKRYYGEYAGKADAITEANKLERILVELLHEQRVATLGGDNSKKRETYLRPSISTDSLTANMEGIIEMVIGGEEDNLNKAEIIGANLALATAEEKKNSDNDDRIFLSKFRDKLRREFKRQEMEMKSSMSSNRDEYIEDFIKYTNNYTRWLQNLIDEAGPVVATATDADEAKKKETEIKDERSPENYLKTYLEFYNLAVRGLIGKIKTNPSPQNWTDQPRLAYQRYEPQIPTEDEKKANPKYKEYSDLIDNIGKTWEYSYVTTDTSKAGLTHKYKPEGGSIPVDVYVDPEEWRNIFERYKLADYVYEKGKRVPEKDPETELQKGTFWDIWDMAIQVSSRSDTAYNDPITGKVINEKKFAYGDNLANNVGEYYNHVLNKYFNSDPGKAYLEKLAKSKNTTVDDLDPNLLELIKIQIKSMLDYGGLLDELYAIQAAWGTSMAHRTTEIEIVGGKTIGNWAALRPIENALYNLITRPEANNHILMNITTMTLEDIAKLLERVKDKYRVAFVPEHNGHPRVDADGHELHMPKRVYEFYEAAEQFVDTSIDKDKVLGQFHSPGKFPNFARSILEQGLSLSSRYFATDLAGWAFLWNNLFEPMKDLSEDQAATLIDVFSKEGPGKAKLGGDALTYKEFSDLNKIYLTRVFHAFKGNKRVTKGRAAISKFSKDRIPNTSLETDRLRKRIIDGIQGASTVSYVGSEDERSFLKRDLLEQLNADLKYDLKKDADGKYIINQPILDQVAKVQSKEPLAGKQSIINELLVELNERVIRVQAPEDFLVTFRREKIRKYVNFMYNHHKTFRFDEDLAHLMKEIQSSGDEDGMIDMVHPPYNKPATADDSKPAAKH